METVPAKKIISHEKSAEWFGKDYNMNIYRGCSHGCIYCDSRSECYRIEDFDSVKAKENALKLIRDELRRKVKTGVIATGAMSDPYNPFEEKELLTRHALELINAYGFGIAIATKSDLVTRDIDVLQDIATHSPVIIKITITTFDDNLQKKLELFAPASSARFEAIEKLAKSGIYSGILLMPVLPFINDNWENIENIIKRAFDCGAKFIYPAFGVTLRANQRAYFYDRLDELFPGMKEKYIKRFGGAYNCFCAKELYGRFAAYCESLGILYKMGDIVKNYKTGYEGTQLTFI